MRITEIILGTVLVISLGGNIYLIKNLTDTREQVAVISNQLATAENQIADLQEQLADFEKLQEQVSKDNEQIETLENTLEKSNAQIESLENTITEKDALIADLEEQAQAQISNSKSQNKSNSSASTSGSNNGNNNDPLVGMPGYEGPKPGLEYVPGMGYVVPGNDPGGNLNPGQHVITQEEADAGEHYGNM